MAFFMAFGLMVFSLRLVSRLVLAYELGKGIRLAINFTATAIHR